MNSLSPFHGEAADNAPGDRPKRDPFLRGLILIGAISSFLIAFSIWKHSRSDQPLHDGSTLPITGGTELVAIYIGSSFCAGSSLPRFPQVEQRTFATLAEYAMRKQMRFVRIGVSVDASPTIGMDYLRRLGPFDAVSVGGGWLNPLAITYLWRDQPADGTIPQIVVLQRIVKLTRTGPLLTSDSLLGRLVGIDGMEHWLSLRRRPNVSGINVKTMSR